MNGLQNSYEFSQFKQPQTTYRNMSQIPINSNQMSYGLNTAVDHGCYQNSNGNIESQNTIAFYPVMPMLNQNHYPMLTPQYMNMSNGSEIHRDSGIMLDGTSYYTIDKKYKMEADLSQMNLVKKDEQKVLNDDSKNLMSSCIVSNQSSITNICLDESGMKNMNNGCQVGLLNYQDFGGYCFNNQMANDKE
ncbi:hypothetical protein RF11_00132 [Thelohanellus kitauei]|uniref:Uncharacterized protein n=1 Tax=Thelohanellus kitauei TaxID=669202 RepID=A0A0C2N1V2_THEKT|nr:hypothetical protein RF11_00132 [Thelohanellus kitauei]